METVKGTVVVVTGAGRGIGRAIAKSLGARARAWC
jgi:NAD(P)-dependent dehydrogenase (short-subunit alcohol dehydrogenase family)